jgi:hypothetical protein
MASYTIARGNVSALILAYYFGRHPVGSTSAICMDVPDTAP